VKRLRTQISVTGFTQQEVEGGLQDLLDEFVERPWLLAASAHWDGDRQRLVVSIDREGDSLAIQGGDSGATFDEVWDCVIACFNFSSDGIHFDVDSNVFV
jgi:hypothetical protein